VGSFPPNPFGLYDMAGNAWQWRSRLWKDYPYRADDGREDIQTHGGRVVRGGLWDRPADGCRAGCRSDPDPGNCGFGLGFRVVLAPGAP